jgi:hypothetical protein
MVHVPTVISASAASMPADRPSRSAMRPIRSAPTGRITKPAPNVASDSSSDDTGFAAGKNSRPMITAEKL